jgi:hypothetical protein
MRFRALRWIGTVLVYVFVGSFLAALAWTAPFGLPDGIVAKLIYLGVYLGVALTYAAIPVAIEGLVAGVPILFTGMLTATISSRLHRNLTYVLCSTFIGLATAALFFWIFLNAGISDWLVLTGATGFGIFCCACITAGFRSRPSRTE